MRRVSALVLAATLAGTACDQSSTPVAPQHEADLLSVTANQAGDPLNSASSLDGFYWLPPTVKKAAKDFAGTFDPNLLDALAIQICPVTGDPSSPADCTSIIRTLSGSSQPEIIRVNPDPDKEDYSVTWQSTDDDGQFVAANTYRAFVTVELPSWNSRTVGVLDLLAVDKRGDLKGPSNPDRLPGFVVGQPLVFKFRIETGIPGELIVSPTAAELFDTDTPGEQQAFTATLTDLHGDPMVGSTVDWVSSSALVALSVTSGPTDGSGESMTIASPTTTVATDTDVDVTASHADLSATAVLTIKPTPCTLSSLPDTDGDRLPDCVETNTGVFVSTLDTGTDPTVADTDGDAISDGDEVLGTLAGLDLPGLGVSPLVPSILLEYDWFDDGGHSHRPTAVQVAMVTASFAAQGIEVIHDYGQGPAPFDRGNLIADADGNVDGFGPEYFGYKAANFDANRNGYFHYVFVPHSYNFGGSSGLAQYPGDDIIVATLTFYTNNLAVAGTIQHELGHNLFLHHGGGDAINRKPNYNSVMSYNYQFGGVDNNCTPPRDGVLDYSHGLNPSLNENNLDETQGICGNPPGPGWDWNQDGDAVDVGIAVDINHQWNTMPYPVVGDGSFNILIDYDDWGNLVYTGISDLDGAGVTATQIISCQVPPESL
jgi:hypothetical protein